MWKSNNSLLNNKWSEEKKTQREFRKFLETNEKNTAYQNLQDA